MSPFAKSTLGFAAGRIAYAVAVVVAPKQAAGPWLGDAAQRGGGRVASRGLVARDAFLAVGAAVAALNDQPVRPWLVACIASDVADITATLADREQLPSHAALGTVLVAGAAAAGGARLFAAAER
jgi:hypothetical protein